ncbi:MAG: YhcH/YjgK/YiaL family protein [Verrucomicrobia bacterium]|nr:YhcH/YjgK/YiaL family protein [Verrucomicrobiota bacterium]MBU4247629.1 YhcH/YjgK/YiaL family protein [Verrucomicrobiota bacterium]MBU4290810.1 YhcH/YjgK/YiaL family protein [Verrucomicrobiota bacterium]MBU4428356.1 YhcH/YjgK/YiaL family protein [Verrucomicrobiota bacterium]MBU4496659.1 YhcH/YjgK/YiaL family protein [Verrucomicrobiota bacterium]
MPVIIDQLDHAACYFGIGSRVAAGLQFLRETNLAGLDNGRHEIDGDAIQSLVCEYQTKPMGQSQWEARRRWLKKL